jgi:negative regulator of flagellin synthesis FlgM
MAIEINGNGLPPALPKNAGEGTVTPLQRQGQNPAAAQEQPRDKPEAGSADNVSLTETSARLQELQKVLEALPSEDGTRVQALRKALADGSYQVDPERVADRLLQFESLFKNTV